MALTKSDLQAIQGLLMPINDRLDKMDERFDRMDKRLDGMDNRLDKIDSEVSSLKSGQLDIRKDLKNLDRKVSSTYELALDAWGNSTENRKWLEKSITFKSGNI